MSPGSRGVVAIAEDIEGASGEGGLVDGGVVSRSPVPMAIPGIEIEAGQIPVGCQGIGNYPGHGLAEPLIELADQSQTPGGKSRGLTNQTLPQKVVDHRLSAPSVPLAESCRLAGRHHRQSGLQPRCQTLESNPKRLSGIPAEAAVDKSPTVPAGYPFCPYRDESAPPMSGDGSGVSLPR